MVDLPQTYTVQHGRYAYIRLGSPCTEALDVSPGDMVFVTETDDGTLEVEAV